MKISAPEAVFEPRGARAALEGYFRLFSDLERATAEDVLTVFRTPSRGLPYEHEQTVVDGLRAGLTFREIVTRLPAGGRGRHRMDGAAVFLDDLSRISGARPFIRRLRGAGGLDKHFREYEQLFGGVEAVELEQLEDAERHAEGMTVAQFAQRLAEQTQALRSIRDDEHGIEITTVHRAKGREWPIVIVFGMDEEQLPHKRSLEDAQELTSNTSADAIESERRIAYVAVTRAREKLVLLSTKGKPSRFLAEAGLVEKPKVRPVETGLPEVGASRRRRQPGIGRPRHAPLPSVSVGQRIDHPLFGEGEVLEVEGQKLQVQFATAIRNVTVSRQITLLS